MNPKISWHMLLKEALYYFNRTKAESGTRVFRLKPEDWYLSLDELDQSVLGKMELRPPTEFGEASHVGTLQCGGSCLLASVRSGELLIAYAMV